ncbi:MAG TPA: hypothetical protein VFV73_20800 [Streptosporangiaceae bacterium]|nr:hypothetical protein [Streptosporangiaceae bacterium]
MSTEEVEVVVVGGQAGIAISEHLSNAGLPRGERACLAEGTIGGRFVVAATGPFQRPVIPPIIPGTASVEQLHSAAYRNPG